MTAPAVLPGFRAPKAHGSASAAITHSYKSLSKTVRDAGLLGRATGFYVRLLAVQTLALAVLVAVFVLLGDSWFQLLVAAGLGIVMTQFAFVAHEAAHRQVFASGPLNDRVGRLLANAVVGISYSWWMTKHSRHHANPNKAGADPDIEPGVLRFSPQDAALRTGPGAWFGRVQGYLFFPLLTLEGLNLHVTSVRSLVRNEKGRDRAVELTTIALRIAAYVGVVFWALPIGMGFAFLGVQLAVFGVYMGASFAPNHKGMAMVPEGTKIDFLTKQVLTSRNIRGGRFMSHLMGGLNYQVEHHLFPSMPRPHLAHAAAIVKEYCATHGVPYTETSLAESYRIVVRYLNAVGLGARDPFDCPMYQELRGV